MQAGERLEASALQPNGPQAGEHGEWALPRSRCQDQRARRPRAERVCSAGGQGTGQMLWVVRGRLLLRDVPGLPSRGTSLACFGGSGVRQLSGVVFKWCLERRYAGRCRARARDTGSDMGERARTYSSTLLQLVFPPHKKQCSYSNRKAELAAAECTRPCTAEREVWTAPHQGQPAALLTSLSSVPHHGHQQEVLGAPGAACLKCMVQ